MENSKKMICGFFFLPFFISCMQEIKNRDYIAVKEDVLYFKHFTFNTQSIQDGSYKKGDSIFFSKVLFNQKNILNSKIVDSKTFDALYNDSDDRKKVKNDYYLRGNDYYFKDKNYVYVYQQDGLNDKSSPTFFIAGKVDEYEILGGSYLRVGSEIYCKGIKINNVDVATFKTAKMLIPDSEWDKTIGFDKNSIYIEENREAKSKLQQYKNDITGINIDSLQRKYIQ